MDGTWNLRTTPNPLIRAAGRGLARANARHPWDHNAHFHRWILRALPTRLDRVLDVGCGRGTLLARLAARAERAEGIDPDPGMARAPRLQCAPSPERRCTVAHSPTTPRCPA